ncbi:type 4a pilus biogenesis protein PilO [Paludibacterium paludis]|uniref:Type 4 fimbrial biogenesis protein PilO n=1 Tax=Paludibacterium paludis TaxID=1225769 RepID=A0A918UAC8_9NEIS|nr:type 4a pilus biogenesis protein PilO [Paludibacterium paludis]GGY16541.1 type 4 fimbrial biogenesis protein PilO [Paludibacterium paludis]
MTLDELRQLDLRTMADWPVRRQCFVAALLGTLVLAGGYTFLLDGPLARLDDARRQETELRQTYIEKLRAVHSLAEQERQLRSVEGALAQLIRQLPTRSNIASLLADINQAGAGRDVRFELFRPEPEVIRGDLAEVPISLRVTGTYRNVVAFTADMAKLPRIVTLSELTLAPGKSGRMTLQAKLRTFRALEADEQAARTVTKPLATGRKTP